MKKLLIAAGSALLLIAIGIFAIAVFFDADVMRPRLEAGLTRALGRETKVGKLKLDLFAGAVTADELTVADDRNFSATPFLHAKSLKLSVELWPLISSRELHVSGLGIDRPEIALIQSQNGGWNFSGIGSTASNGGAARSPQPEGARSGGTVNFAADLIRLTDGRLSVMRTGAAGSGASLKAQTLEGLTLEVRNFSPKGSFPFSMDAKLGTGGEISLDGKAGPMNATDAAATPVDLTMKVHDLRIAASGLLGSVNDIDGILSIDGAGSSRGDEIKWNGKVRIDKARLSKGGTPDTKPVEFDFALDHNLKTHSGSLSKGAILLGSAPAHLTGTYAEDGDALALKMRLEGSAMPVPELISLLPPLDIRLPNGSSLQGGTASVEATIEGPVNDLVTDAAVSVARTKLVGFNLGAKLRLAERIAGLRPSPDTEIESLSAKIHSTSQGQIIRDLSGVAPSIGNLDGTGTISPNHVLDFKMHAFIHTQGVLMAAIGQGNGATIPFVVGGTAEDPQIRPDLKGIASNQAKNLASAVSKGTSAVGGLLGVRKQ